VKNSKPDPEPLILACKMLDLDPASVCSSAMTCAISSPAAMPAPGRRR
jgi:hypothetical protein